MIRYILQTKKKLIKVVDDQAWKKKFRQNLRIQ